MNHSASAASLTVLLAAGLAGAGTLDVDRGYAAELRSDAAAFSALNTSASNITVSAGLRFGYNANFRDNAALGDNDTTIGFGFHEAQIRLSGDVTDSISATVSLSFDTDATGIDNYSNSSTPTLEDAYADWMINDGLTLRIGQFIQAYSAGRSISDFHGTHAFRSATQERVGDVAWTQGVEAHFGGDIWSGVVGFTDGPFYPANSAFNSGNEFDYAISARFDLFSDSDKARFDDRASWRGSSAAWRVGVGAIYGEYGDTNPSAVDGDETYLTVDAAYEGDGWQINAAYFLYMFDPAVGAEQDDSGFEIAGSLFVTDQAEVFARFDMIMLEEVVNAPEDTFSYLTGGVNYYLVPESHAARLTAELGYSFQDGSAQTAGASGNFAGFLGNSDGEFTLSLLAQFLF